MITQPQMGPKQMRPTQLSDKEAMPAPTIIAPHINFPLSTAMNDKVTLTTPDVEKSVLSTPELEKLIWTNFDSRIPQASTVLSGNNALQQRCGVQKMNMTLNFSKVQGSQPFLVSPLQLPLEVSSNKNGLHNNRSGSQANRELSFNLKTDIVTHPTPDTNKLGLSTPELEKMIWTDYGTALTQASTQLSQNSTARQRNTAPVSTCGNVYSQPAQWMMSQQESEGSHLLNSGVSTTESTLAVSTCSVKQEVQEILPAYHNNMATQEQINDLNKKLLLEDDHSSVIVKADSHNEKYKPMLYDSYQQNNQFSKANIISFDTSTEKKKKRTYKRRTTVCIVDQDSSSPDVANESKIQSGSTMLSSQTPSPFFQSMGSSNKSEYDQHSLGLVEHGVLKEECSSPTSVSPELYSSEDDGISIPLSPLDMSTQESYKMKRRKQKNREAAAKCRKKKLDLIAQLEANVKVLHKENAELEATRARLQNDVFSLKEKLNSHVQCGCHISFLNQNNVLQSSTSHSFMSGHNAFQQEYSPVDMDHP